MAQMDTPAAPNGSSATPTVAALFDQLCLRWAREADVVVQQEGSLAPTLVVLPRDKDADEVAIRLDGLRGNLSEHGPALVAEIRPQTDPLDPRGLVLLMPMRLAAAGAGPDGVAVYVTLGAPDLRRALGYLLDQRSDGTKTLRRTDDPNPALFSWLEALLRRESGS
jgi:hypothetical protein